MLKRPGSRAVPLVLALASLVLGGVACDSGPPATPSPVLIPTIPPPRVAPPAVEATAPPTAAPPAAADRARAAALLDRWAVGPAPSGPAPAGVPMGQTAAGDYLALALQQAPVVTPTAGLQVEPAVLVTAAGGAPRTLASAVSNGTDLLVPTTVVWAEHGAAAVVLFTWHVHGQAVEPQPFVLLDPAGTRQGPVLWTLAATAAPAWAPAGAGFAYLDAAAAPPRLAVADPAGRPEVSGPAANLECAGCWPDGRWAPDGRHWAYVTAAALPESPTPGPFGHLTWRLVVLDVPGRRIAVDRQGAAGDEAHVAGWPDAVRLQVVLRHPLVPADQITGQQGQWQDTPYILRLDTNPPRFDPAPPDSTAPTPGQVPTPP